jgi:hypothetical protein
MRILHIDTISRKDAKKLAPSGYVLRKKVGGFIAYESKVDAPPSYNGKPARRGHSGDIINDDDKKYRKQKNKELFLKSIGSTTSKINLSTLKVSSAVRG